LDGNETNDLIGIWMSGGDLTVRDCKFEQLARGLNIGGSNVKVVDNVFYNMRSDGLDVGQVSNILVDGNSFYDFGFLSGDHRDAIQFMTVGSSRSSSDIVVSNNLIMVGPGASMQGIFITDQQGIYPYLRVKIRNNLVVQTYMSNGIMVANGQDVEVTNNTVVSPTDDSIMVWIRMSNVSNYRASGNIADSGGNMTGIQAGIDPTLLKYGKIESVRPEQLIRPNIGFQMP
ncbi:MAG: right-handed parallel beta-helix repeat-containing protein, partial [Bdellovibrionota bacterium]